MESFPFGDNRQVLAEIKAIPEFKAIKSKQRRFILAYSKTFQVQGAGKVSGVSWVNHYFWLRSSPAYKQAFEVAKEIASDHAEGDVYERAFIGTERKRSKMVEGEVIEETYRHKSDLLSIFMLKGLKPQYRDSFNIQAISGPITLSISHHNATKLPEIDVTNESQSLPAPTKANRDK